MADFNTTHNLAVWFDLPVHDLDRAIAFYEAVLETTITRESPGDFEFGVFAHGPGNGGCLVPGTGEIADQGALIYLNADGRLREALERVTARGGPVKQDIPPVGPLGFRAVITDSEGNCVALHSRTGA